MKSLKFYYALVLFILTTTASAHESLLNVAPGWNMPSSYLRFAGFNSIYFKNELIRNPDEVKRTEAFRHIQSGFEVAYTISPKFEIKYKQFLYQDHHLGDKTYNFPADAILNIKYAALEPLTSAFKFGLSFSSRLPFAKTHNALMEPFAADRIALALTSHISYSPDRLIPESVFNMHFNLGYINYANTGETVINAAGQTEEVIAPTQAIQYGAAFVFPANSYSLSFELFGNTFIEKPPKTAYSRESFFYFSPAFTFPLFAKLNLRLGADLRISSNQGLAFTTEDGGQLNTFKLNAYPSWRLTAGLNFEIPLRTPAVLKEIKPLLRSNDSGQVQASAIDSTSTEEKLYEDDATRRRRIKRELTREELERLKKQRMERDNLLENLRKKIQKNDAQKKKKKSRLQDE